MYVYVYVCVYVCVYMCVCTIILTGVHLIPVDGIGTFIIYSEYLMCTHT